jgi:putative peptide zinc metalloprotease protein
MMGAVAALPPLRDELTVHAGPVGADGAPTYTLHDPLRNQFFRLTWAAFEIVSRWGLGNPEAIAEAASAETTLALGPEAVLQMYQFLAGNQLLRADKPADTRRLLAIARAAKTSWAGWLLHHYLFFRIPLVRPDRLLSRLLPWVAWFGGRGFRIATMLALTSGLFLAGREWETFAATLVDHLSLTGLAALGMALGLAKVVHELAHALTAKTFGCRVPTMGAAFLVMMPVLYTDVNEAWKLPDRRPRLLIGGAGILAELALAAWATLAWGLLPEGTVRSMAFTLAAATWVSSLAINLSPFMRFDGYFLLMDALDTPNLHSRAFALARWWLREALFGLGEAAPEVLPARRRAGLIAFAFAVWIYRLTLFLGIAVLVYHFFIKVIGVFLFAVEIGWFVARPFVMEFAEWRKRADTIIASPRSRLTFGAGLVLLGLAVVPWSGQVKAPAMLKAADHAAIYPPSPGVLTNIAVRDGQKVVAGQVLARLDNPDMDYQLAQAGRRIATLRYELASISFEDSFRGRSQAIAKELASAEAEAAAVAAEKARLVLTAPIEGIVTDLSPLHDPGQWIGPKEPLMAVRLDSHATIDAFVSEEDLPRIAVSDSARFLPEGSAASLPASVAAIDRIAVRTLADPELATPFGGAILARATKQALVPDKAVYRVRLVPADGKAVLASLRGTIIIDGARESWAAQLWRTAAAVLLREFGT